MAGLVVGSNGSGDGRERNACGGRISISGGLGQLTGGGSVVQAHKATVDSASSIGLNGHIDGNLLDDGVALLADDADAVDVLGDDLDGGLCLPFADGSGLQGLLLDGCVPLGLSVARTLDPAEADEGDAERRSGRKPVTLPNGETAPVRPWDVAPTSIQLALARGHRWLAMLESGEAKSLKEIATREGIDNSYVSRMVNLTTLAPDIVAAILEDALPNHVTLFDLAVDPPALWDEQRERVGL